MVTKISRDYKLQGVVTNLCFFYLIIFLRYNYYPLDTGLEADLTGSDLTGSAVSNA